MPKAASSRAPRDRPSRSRELPPLDEAALERLALRYVERFATSRGRLADYLGRKLRERGGEGDTRAVAERMAERGYVDDDAYAEARARGLARKGMGARRVSRSLRQAGIDDAGIARATEDASPLEAALAFARRKRIGPFAKDAPDAKSREKQIAALVRAGHDHRLARRIVDLPPGAEIDADALE